MNSMLSTEEKTGLGVALNESTLLGVEIDTSRCLAAATLALLTLPEVGPMPQDTRLQLRFEGVGRAAASLRRGHWNDANAPVEVFRVDQLLEVVRSFGGLPIYGWEFIDQDADIARSMRLFQEGPLLRM